jgi:hypothetical protein
LPSDRWCVGGNPRSVRGATKVSGEKIVEWLSQT